MSYHSNWWCLTPGVICHNRVRLGAAAWVGLCVCAVVHSYMILFMTQALWETLIFEFFSFFKRQKAYPFFSNTRRWICGWFHLEVTFLKIWLILKVNNQSGCTILEVSYARERNSLGDETQSRVGMRFSGVSLLSTSWTQLIPSWYASTKRGTYIYWL